MMSQSMATKRERGFTLLVALIMLVLVTLVVVMSFGISQSNLKVVNNLQRHAEAVGAAQEAVNTVVNSSDFTSNPTAPLPAAKACNGQSNLYCVDANGDSNQDYKVTVTAACKKFRAIRNDELNLATSTEDRGCVTQQAQAMGVVGTISGESLCSDTLWEVGASAVDQTSPAKASTYQGVSVRVSRDDAASACP